METFSFVQCHNHSLTSFQTQRYIRVYDLSKQELLKKLQSSAKWISSMAIHPKGLFICMFQLLLVKAAFKHSNIQTHDGDIGGSISVPFTAVKHGRISPATSLSSCSETVLVRDDSYCTSTKNN
jgi:hypothetical protein